MPFQNAEIAATGHFALLEELRAKMPGEFAEIAALPGFGPKQVRLLHDQLGVSTVADLRRAAAAGRLRTLRGFRRSPNASSVSCCSAGKLPTDFSSPLPRPRPRR